MTPLRFAFITLLVTTAGVATVVCRRRSDHAPVAWYLSAVAMLDLSRLWLQPLLPTDDAPREGLMLYLRHLDQAAYLTLIGALPAMSMALFLRRRPWLIGAVLTGSWVYIVASYPELRGAELMWLYTALELAGALASVGCFLMWLRHGDELSTPVLCGLTLVSASLASVMLPALAGEGALTHWPVIVALHAVSLAVVLVLQLRALMTPARAARG